VKSNNPIQALGGQKFLLKLAARSAMLFPPIYWLTDH